MAAGGNRSDWAFPWLPLCRLSVLGEGCLLLPRPRYGQEAPSREVAPLGPDAHPLSLSSKRQGLPQHPLLLAQDLSLLPVVSYNFHHLCRQHGYSTLLSTLFEWACFFLSGPWLIPFLPAICTSFLSISPLIALSLPKMLSLFPSIFFDPAHSTFIFPNS